MRFKATHDALTSLWNRGMILELLHREMERFKRGREPGEVSVILGDVDHFKNVNDSHGHAAGDEVLKEVAARLVGSVRSYDAVSRYGGEEFLIVMAGCGLNCASARAEQIRKAIGGRPAGTSQGDVGVTISLGVASSSEWPELDGDGLIREADLALYQAKKDGRNRVGVARPNGIVCLMETAGSPEPALSGKESERQGARPRP
jgi:diguanylate cyclase (GGDEF)-like protein